MRASRWTLRPEVLSPGVYTVCSAKGEARGERRDIFLAIRLNIDVALDRSYPIHIYIYTHVSLWNYVQGVCEGGRRGERGGWWKRGEGVPYLEQFSKIRAASGKYDAVRFEASAIAGQCDVHKILIVPQVLKCRRYTALVIVPSQTKVLRIYHRYIYSPTIRKRTVRYSSNRWKLDTYLITHRWIERKEKRKEKKKSKKEKKEKRKEKTIQQLFFFDDGSKGEREREREMMTTNAFSNRSTPAVFPRNTKFESRNFLVARVINRGIDKFSITGFAFEIRKERKRERKKRKTSQRDACNAIDLDLVTRYT